MEPDCQCDPIYKLLDQLGFEDLCQESKIHTLPATKSIARTFTQSQPEDKYPLLDPIIDQFAYLETYGYKIAHSAGYNLANNLLVLIYTQ